MKETKKSVASASCNGMDGPQSDGRPLQLKLCNFKKWYDFVFVLELFDLFFRCFLVVFRGCVLSFVFSRFLILEQKLQTKHKAGSGVP